MSIQLEFEQYHDDHPQVYEEFVRLAFEGIAAGKTRLSSKFIFEMLRWHNRLPRVRNNYKFNNNFTSRYSRMFIAEFKAHADLFEVREIVTT